MQHLQQIHTHTVHGFHWAATNVEQIKLACAQDNFMISNIKCNKQWFVLPRVMKHPQYKKHMEKLK